MTVSTRAGALAQRLSPFASVFLRVAVGLVFLRHGMMKLNMGVAGVGTFLGHLGIPFPGVFAVVVLIVETFGAACVVLGLLTRLWAFCMAVEMVVAIFLAIVPQGRTPELEGLLLAGALALVLLGDGPLALGALLPKKQG